MKKIKKIWQENSVLLVLMIILIACLIAMSVVVYTYFVGDSGSKYGDRLSDIEDHPFSEKDASEVASKIKEVEAINDCKVRVSGKTIYVTITFNPGITLVDAQGKASATLDSFSEDVKSYYDLEFLIKADATDKMEGFQIIGSRNVKGTGGIVWNNNTPVVDDEE